MAVLVQKPEGEILGMGGPWIGAIFWQGRRLPGHYLMQPEVLDADGKYAVTVQTNQPDVTARNQVAFWLVVVDLVDGELYRSRTSWLALYAESFTDQQIGIYSLFYAGSSGQKQYVPFNEQHFQRAAWLV